jgi:hypothetical protein
MTEVYADPAGDGYLVVHDGYAWWTVPTHAAGWRLRGPYRGPRALLGRLTSVQTARAHADYGIPLAR